MTCSRRITAAVGVLELEANGLNILASVCERLGRHQEAIEIHRKMLETVDDTGFGREQAEALIGLGIAHHHQGDHAQAHHCLQQASTSPAGPDTGSSKRGR